MHPRLQLLRIVSGIAMLLAWSNFWYRDGSGQAEVMLLVIAAMSWVVLNYVGLCALTGSAGFCFVVLGLDGPALPGWMPVGMLDFTFVFAPVVISIIASELWANHFFLRREEIAEGSASF